MANIVDTSLRQSLLMSDGAAILLMRPISAVIVTLGLLVLVVQFVGNGRRPAAPAVRVG